MKEITDREEKYCQQDSRGSNNKTTKWETGGGGGFSNRNLQKVTLFQHSPATTLGRLLQSNVILNNQCCLYKGSDFQFWLEIREILS